MSASFSPVVHIHFRYPLAEAEKAGYVAPARYYLVAFTDGDSLPGTCAMLARALQTGVVDSITPPVGRSVMCFWSSVERAKEAAARLAVALGDGNAVRCVHGGSSDMDVRTTITEFKSGAIMTCQRLVEGVNLSFCSAVILGDSTDSYKRLAQCFGRASRPGRPPKPFASLIVCASTHNLGAVEKSLAAIRFADERYGYGFAGSGSGGPGGSGGSRSIQVSVRGAAWRTRRRARRRPRPRPRRTQWRPSQPRRQRRLRRRPLTPTSTSPTTSTATSLSAATRCSSRCASGSARRCGGLAAGGGADDNSVRESVRYLLSLPDKPKDRTERIPFENGDGTFSPYWTWNNGKDNVIAEIDAKYA